MRLILDIKESKAAFIIELLKNFSFVKIKTVSKEKSEQLESIAQAFSEVELIQEGKLKGIPANELIDEL